MSEDTKKRLGCDLKTDFSATIPWSRREMGCATIAETRQLSCVRNFGHIGSRADCRTIGDLIG
jgi:hypothetical protein